MGLATRLELDRLEIASVTESNLRYFRLFKKIKELYFIIKKKRIYFLLTSTAQVGAGEVPGNSKYTYKSKNVDTKFHNLTNNE